MARGRRTSDFRCGLADREVETNQIYPKIETPNFTIMLSATFFLIAYCVRGTDYLMFGPQNLKIPHYVVEYK